MFTVTFGVPEDQTAAVAEILYEAFHHKFAAIFGPKQQTITLLSEHLRDDRTVTAFHQNTLVGVGALKFGGKESIDISFWHLLRTLKFGIFRFLVLGWIFFSSVKNDELFVDMLAVAPAMRRKGVGGALMDFIIDFAQSKGYTSVRLFVIDTNEPAKRFYETKGFKEKRVHTLIFPWNRILEFDSAYEMVYTV